ncbi:MAG: hypothetical protein KA142_01185 [Chromatiaceae bacterium]|nr:hypothetical protein [Chromatiaceae bacterium]
MGIQLGPPRAAAPELSIVVVFFDMAREGPRTLLSLVPPYQRGLEGVDYEIIGIEHGSRRPLVVPDLPELRQRLRMIQLPQAPVSPVRAINAAVREQCRGRYVMICIDGARIASSHLVCQSLAACRGLRRPLVLSLAWHLGPEVQSQSVPKGYSREREDALLAGIGWPAHPDRLFEIAVFAGSSLSGYFRPISESNAFTLERDAFLASGGYQGAFVSPGGGLANLEVLTRLVAAHAGGIVTLIGDGTFHQHHGGAATSNQGYFEAAQPEHRAIVGRDYAVAPYPTWHSARMVPAAHPFFVASVEMARPPAPPAAPGPGTD